MAIHIIPHPEITAEVIENSREQMNLTQHDLALRAQISQGWISKLESAKIKRISDDKLNILAVSLGLDPQELLYGQLPVFGSRSEDSYEQFVRSVRTELQADCCFALIGPNLSVAGKDSINHVYAEITKQLQEYEHKIKKTHNSQLLTKITSIWQHYLKSDIPNSEKHEFMERVFCVDKEPNLTHLQLAQIRPRGICTLNHDQLLEKAYAIVHGQSVVPLRPAQFRRSISSKYSRFFIAKLRGDASDWQNIILDLKDTSLRHVTTHMLKLFRGSSVLVVGFEAEDQYLNDFLAQKKNTKAFVILPNEPTKATRKALLDFPDTHLIVVNASSLPVFLGELCPPPIPAQRVYDATWGQMPTQTTPLDFPEATAALREFLFSKNKMSVITAPASSGLSSFLAARVQEYSKLSNMLIYRLEGKTWLPIEAYTLFIIGHLPPKAFNVYIEKRRHEASGWSLKMEAKALAESLSSVGSRVIIFIDLAHRLDSNNALGFWETFIQNASDNVKLIMTSNDHLKLSQNHIRIKLGKPTYESLLRILSCHCKQTNAKKILESMPNADMNTLILLASAVGNGIYDLDRNEKQISEITTKFLCQVIIEHLKKTYNATYVNRILEACATFHTPRELTWISSCSGYHNQRKIREFIQHLCKLGILIQRIPFANSIDKPLYYMPTTICAVLADLLYPANKKTKQKIMSARAAKVFEKLSIDNLRGKEASRSEVVRAVPIICCALFHYQGSGDRDGYINLVIKAAEYLKRLYHSNVLKKWMSIPLIIEHPNSSAPIVECRRALMDANIAKAEANPSQYGEHLKIAKDWLKHMEKHDPNYMKMKLKLQYEEGIWHSMKRDYHKALMVFGKLYKNAHDNDEDIFLNAIERQIQTYLSLGKLKSAEKKLSELWSYLDDSSFQSKLKKYTHHLSMSHRHESTLKTVRLLTFAFRPKDSEVSWADLVNSALNESKECRRRSEHVGYAPSRFGLPDETGIGISMLKQAQAYYAAMRFSDSFKAANEGVAILTNFPNNRWWRMSCHDLASRSAAMLHIFAEAKHHIEQAKKIYDNSGKEDILRECELKHAEGIIAFQMGQVEQSVELFQQSLEFTSRVTSPCVQFMHLLDLTKALIFAGEIQNAQDCLKNAQCLKIDW